MRTKCFGPAWAKHWYHNPETKRILEEKMMFEKGYLTNFITDTCIYYIIGVLFHNFDTYVCDDKK